MGTFDLPWIRKIAAIAVLGDENRRKLYEYVLNAGSAVGRDEAALTLGLPPRSSVSFHLDRLVREGLLQVEFRKSPDRTGPGSGRPSKLYRPMVDEIGVSIPERHYDLAGHLMAAAIQRAESDGAPVEAALREVASARGSELGRPGDFLGAISELGYHPTPRCIRGGIPPAELSLPSPVAGPQGGSVRHERRLPQRCCDGSGLSADVVVPDPDHGPGHCCARITILEGDS